MWPNLGVNMPEGAARSVSGLHYIQCPICNTSGNKPHPDQDKLDTAKEIDEAGRRWQHALMFDGSSLVDTWDANQLHPRKYRV